MKGSTIRAIVRRDLLRYVRSPGRTALLLLMPLTIAATFAVVFGGGGPDEVKLHVLVYDEDDGLLSHFLSGASGNAEAAKHLDLTAVGPEGYEMMERGEASALLHVPKGFTADFLDGLPVTLELTKNPAERFLPVVIEEGIHIGATGLSEVSRVFRPELTQVRALLTEDGKSTDAAVAALAVGVMGKVRGLDRYVLPPVVDLETVTLDDPDRPADDVGFLSLFLPGVAVMGILFIAQSATRDLLRERESGMLRHILSAPVTVRDYLAGRCLAVVAVTGTGFVILMLCGLAAGATWGAPLPAVALALATSVAASGLLLLIMSVVGSERQGDTLGTIVILVTSMVGGSFMPVSQLPRFLLPLSRMTVGYWATSGFDLLVSRAGGMAEIAPNLAVLLGGGAALLVVAAGLVRRRIERGMA